MFKVVCPPKEEGRTWADVQYHTVSPDTGLPVRIWEAMGKKSHGTINVGEVLRGVEVEIQVRLLD